MKLEKKSHRNSFLQMFCKVGVVRNCSKLTGMHCFRVSFWYSCRSPLRNFIKKWFRDMCFSVVTLHTFNFSWRVSGRKFLRHLTHWRPKFPIIYKPVNWFALQINWLVFIWWGTLVVNGLIKTCESKLFQDMMRANLSKNVLHVKL